MKLPHSYLRVSMESPLTEHFPRPVLPVNSLQGI